MGVWGAEPPNGGMAAIPNSEVISITPELLFPHLGAGDDFLGEVCVLCYEFAFQALPAARPGRWAGGGCTGCRWAEIT